MSWKASFYSSIGVQHQKLKMPCQDYAAYNLVNNEIIIGAVADGAGSAKLSHQGAELTVTKTIEYLTSCVDTSQETCVENLTNFDNSQLLTIIVDCLKQKAENENCLLKDLACTLVAFIATPKYLLGIQIGDGFLVIREQQKEEYELVFKPDKGEYANETTFVTSDDALNQMKVKEIKGYYPFICATTNNDRRTRKKQKLLG